MFQQAALPSTDVAAAAEEADSGDEKKPEDAFLTRLSSKTFSLTDCLVKVEGAAAAFKTIEEQNKYFAEKMKLMAREGHDEEDGWHLATRFEEKELDVHERKVEWSNTVQLRSRWTAMCGSEKLANSILFDESTGVVRTMGKFLARVASFGSRLVEDGKL